MFNAIYDIEGQPFVYKGQLGGKYKYHNFVTNVTKWSSTPYEKLADAAVRAKQHTVLHDD